VFFFVYPYSGEVKQERRAEGRRLEGSGWETGASLFPVTSLFTSYLGMLFVAVVPSSMTFTPLLRISLSESVRWISPEALRLRKNRVKELVLPDGSKSREDKPPTETDHDYAGDHEGSFSHFVP